MGEQDQQSETGGVRVVRRARTEGNFDVWPSGLAQELGVAGDRKEGPKLWS